jgi:anti-sigma-K factor RskA
MSAGTDEFDEAQRDVPLIAAEHALGLLEGEELMEARGALATDPRFAWRRTWWDNWFAPLTDQMPGAEPDSAVWPRIEREIAQLGAARAGSADAQVAVLDAKVRQWKWTAALTSIAAAVAFALIIFAPMQDSLDSGETSRVTAAEPLVASLPILDTPLRLGVTYLPEREAMLVSAAGLESDGVHDHELWLVPADGGLLRSLGVVQPGTDRRLPLNDEMMTAMRNGASLVLTREPIGGKPEGVDAGPVVAEGTFAPV